MPLLRTSRRQVLGMLSATLLGRSAFAQGGGPRIIDTHHHIYPPQYVAPNLDRLLKDSAALPASAYTSWTPQPPSTRWTRPASPPPSCR